MTAAIAATSLAGAAAPAHAQKTLSTQMHVFGTLSAVWEGDPARGCARAGVCSITGSVVYKPGFVGHVTLGEDGSSTQSGGEPFASALVRVRHGPTAAEGSCADVVTDQLSPFFVRFSGRMAEVSFEEFELSAGRCAGPRGVDLARALPHTTIPLARLESRARVLDLSSRTRFAAGPFTGIVVSSIKVAFTRARPARERLEEQFGGATEIRHARRAGVHLRYRIAGITGELNTDFRGTSDAACATLGACGATGNSAFSLTNARGEIDVFATRLLRRGSKPPRFRATLRALRRGNLGIDAFGELNRGYATVTGRFGSPSGTCGDAVVGETPDMELTTKGRGLKLRLQGASDVVRTRCPGPSEQDVLAGHSVAHGAIPLKALGRRRLQVVVSTARSFDGDGYAGTRRGRLVLTLERVRAAIVIERVTILTGTLELF
jgi:hypothetical protein